jgi:hypothetical protein
MPASGVRSALVQPRLADELLLTVGAQNEPAVLRRRPPTRQLLLNPPRSTLMYPGSPSVEHCRHSCPVPLIAAKRGQRGARRESNLFDPVGRSALLMWVAVAVRSSGKETGLRSAPLIHKSWVRQSGQG